MLLLAVLLSGWGRARPVRHRRGTIQQAGIGRLDGKLEICEAAAGQRAQVEN